MSPRPSNENFGEKYLSYQQMFTNSGRMLAGVQGSGGQIVGHGHLFQVLGLNAAGAMFAVWQVAAIVTAQKYHADINRRLASLEKELQHVKEW